MVNGKYNVLSVSYLLIIELVRRSFVLTNVTYFSMYVDINRNNGLSGLIKATTTSYHKWIEN